MEGLARHISVADANQDARDEHLRREGLIAYMRQAQVNGWVMGALGIALVSWLAPHVPTPWLAAWAATDALLVGFAFWTGHRFRMSEVRRVSRRAIRRAALWAGVAGAIWGSIGAMVANLPPDIRMAPLMMIVALACGAATTLAAIPLACAAFVSAILVPASAALAWSGTGDNIALGLMGFVLLGAMITASRQVHRSFVDSVLAAQQNANLLAEMARLREDWLELAGQAEAFAFLDRERRLLLANDSFVRVFELPGAPLRGTPYREVLAAGVGPMPATSGSGSEAGLAAWLDRQERMLSFPDSPIEQRLASGRWLRTTVRTAKEGRIAVIHVDITPLKEREERSGLGKAAA